MVGSPPGLECLKVSTTKGTKITKGTKDTKDTKRLRIPVDQRAQPER